MNVTTGKMSVEHDEGPENTKTVLINMEGGISCYLFGPQVDDRDRRHTKTREETGRDRTAVTGRADEMSRSVACVRFYEARGAGMCINKVTSDKGRAPHS